MPINVTLSADELKALLAMREEHAALQRERDELRSTLRLVTAERDLAEERLRAYRRELFGAKSEARDSDQYGLFNEAEALGANSTPAQEAWSPQAARSQSSARCRALLVAGFDAIGHGGPSPYRQDCKRLRQG